MKNYHKVLGTLGSMVSIALLVLAAFLSINASLSMADDTLYVGDVADNSVQSFDATTGDYLGAAVKKSLAGLKGPRGIILPQKGSLLVSDQNAGSMGAPGDIILYGIGTGKFDRLVQNIPKDIPPFAPRGIILSLPGSDHVFYVADQTTTKDFTPGRVRVYTKDGVFVGDLTPLHTLTPDGYLDEIFHPQGLVIGPDGLLYVSSAPIIGGIGGQVLRFNPSTGAFIDVFISDVPGGIGHLNRPEGLVFSPDGNLLYVTSFRADPTEATDTDKIKIYDGASGAFVDEIVLDTVGPPGTPRAFAGACVFGPGGKLFVPIAGTPPDSGAVRVYDGTTRLGDLVEPGGPLKAGGYLTFGKTNPATLNYEP
jgi:DNA-binding beta-propeller fold protein YncE